MGRSAVFPLLTWEEFSKVFIARFLPTSKRANLAADFEKLKQTLGMLVIEYDMEFTRLSRYAPPLVATEALRAKRFIRGLVDPLFITLALHIGKVTYVEAMNVTLLIESSKIERRASEEATKKPKTLGSFSNGSGSKGGYGP